MTHGLLLLLALVLVLCALSFLAVLQALLLQLWSYFFAFYGPDGKTGGWRRKIDASTATIVRFGVFLLQLGALDGEVV